MNTSQKIYLKMLGYTFLTKARIPAPHLQTEQNAWVNAPEKIINRAFEVELIHQEYRMLQVRVTDPEIRHLFNGTDIIWIDKDLFYQTPEESQQKLLNYLQDQITQARIAYEKAQKTHRIAEGFLPVVSRKLLLKSMVD